MCIWNERRRWWTRERARCCAVDVTATSRRLAADVTVCARDVAVTSAQAATMLNAAGGGMNAAARRILRSTVLQCVDPSIGIAEPAAQAGAALAQVMQHTSERNTAVQHLMDKFQAPLPSPATAKALRACVHTAFFSFYGDDDRMFIENDRFGEKLGGMARCLAARYPVDKLDQLAPVFRRFLA